MQFWTGISWNTQSESYMQSSTEYAWKYQTDALWDTLQLVLLFYGPHILLSSHGLFISQNNRWVGRFLDGHVLECGDNLLYLVL